MINNHNDEDDDDDDKDDDDDDHHHHHHPNQQSWKNVSCFRIVQSSSLQSEPIDILGMYRILHHQTRIFKRKRNFNILRPW